MQSNSHAFSFSNEQLDKCDSIAEECLGVVLRRRLYPKLKSALYENSTKGEYLLVCIDGSTLFTPKEIGIEALVTAFKNGLRSSIEAVKEKNRQLVDAA